MSQTPDSIKELLNQCEFSGALEAIDAIYQQSAQQDRFTLDLYRSQALFEMHRVKDAYQVLAQTTAQTPKESEDYLYVTGRIAYLDQDYDKAEASFRLLGEKSECVTYYYRALIGLANTFYSLKRYPELQGILPELEELCDVVPMDSVLSFKLLKANVFHKAEGQALTAENLLYEVITESSRRRWHYFLIKALYSLAKVAQAQGKTDIVHSNLKLLRCYLNPDEAVLMTYLVNEQFKEDAYTVDAPIKFDAEHKRVGIRDQWIPLHDKPLLYNFMDKLHQAEKFVTKQELARHLWPDQEYVAKSHDPRIFDIARRVRGLIEKHEDQPVCLLSGRYGYKLACSDANAQTDSNKAKASSNSSGKLNKKSLVALGKSPDATQDRT